MKANIKKHLNSNNEINREKIREEITDDVVRQTIAWFLYYLDTVCGYREKRLTQAVNGITDAISAATENGLTSTEILQYLKDKYRIIL